jgi:uncharacterized GH25 family protein
MRILPFYLSAMLAVAVPATAHEFWISPEDYTVTTSDQLLADIRVGQNFKGNAYSFIPKNIVRFDLVIEGKVVPVEGRMGDRPALNIMAPSEGLITVVHQTSESFLNYSEAVKFANFVAHKDFTEVLQEHKARGLPEVGFRERYSRFAKSLIAVGHGEGADRNVGLLTEIVALANPYVDDVSAGFPVLVLYQDSPRTDTQVELFDKAPDGKVTVTKLRTDDAGKAMIPVESGHEYLVDAVVMRALEPEAENDPVWESLWASLTFKMPEAE